MRDVERFGPYMVHERLGAGGMATVHRASLELENDEIRDVALKRLLPQYAADKRFVEDFIREGKLAAQLQHPNIVRILEVGRVARTYFIAMELVRGRVLSDLLITAEVERRGPTLAAVLAMMIELCGALDHAHDAQIVHRDLTPSNLIVDDTGHIRVIDFGVAKALVGMLQTSSGLPKGKLGYMSIEAIGGKQLDTRADVFSAGVVLWELLAMRPLFNGDTEVEILDAVRDGSVEPPSRFNPAVPPQLDAVVVKAVAKARDARWDSAGDMRHALERVAQQCGIAPSADAVQRWVAELPAAPRSRFTTADTDITGPRGDDEH